LNRLDVTLLSISRAVDVRGDNADRRRLCAITSL
jgi:hypothetical protein